MSDVVDALERLVRLRDAGALTAAEFEAQKAAVLRPAGAGACPGCRAPLQLDAFGRCAFCGTPAMPAPALSGAPLPAGPGPDPVADAVARAHPGDRIGAIKALRESAVPPPSLKSAKDRIDAAFDRVFAH